MTCPRLSLSEGTAQMPGFIRANDIITSAWIGAFMLMALANALMIYLPGLPPWSALPVAFAARNSAVYFTRGIRGIAGRSVAG